MTPERPPPSPPPPAAPPPPPLSFRRSFPPRSGVLSLLAAFVTIGIAGGALRSLTGDVILRWLVVAWLGLGVGAVLSMTTRVGHGFRAVTTYLVAPIVGILGLMLLGALGTFATAAIPSLLVCSFIVFAVIGLDLCWVSRVRLLIVLSGLLLLPLVVAEPVPALRWVGAWLITLIVTLWLLNGDVLRGLERPTTPPEAPATRILRPVDLAILAGIGLGVGIVLATLIGRPGWSLEPLGRLAERLPWPEREFRFEQTTLPAIGFEVDDAGHELRYRLDRKGRRFVDGSVGDRLALVEVDGLDRFVDSTGDTIAAFEADGSLVVAPSGDGSPADGLRLLRDDRGWYLPIGDRKLPVVYDQSHLEVRLLDEDGDPIAARGPGDHSALLRPALDAELATALGPNPALPPDTVILATTGIDPHVERGPDGIEITDRYLPMPRHYLAGPELRVEVEVEDGDRLHLRFDRSRQHVTWTLDSLGDLGSSRIDRKGDHFDRGDRSRSSGFDLKLLRDIALALLALAVAVAVWFGVRRWLRRDRSEEIDDRVWAEEEIARLERLGADHEVFRRPADSILVLIARLDGDVDESNGRLLDIGESLDTALYGRRPLGAGERLRVSAVIDRVVADRPRPRRRRRRRDPEAVGAASGDVLSRSRP